MARPAGRGLLLAGWLWGGTVGAGLQALFWGGVIGIVGYTSIMAVTVCRALLWRLRANYTEYAGTRTSGRP